MTRRVAVIGSGVSGLTAAHILQRSCAVTLYEADERPGGHAHTHDVELADGTHIAVDSGFIVHNDRTYPTLLRLFAELHVPTQQTDMSMSVASDATGWQYAGGQGVSGIFADPFTAVRPGFLRMLIDIKRFHRRARAYLDQAVVASDEPLATWLSRGRYSAGFTEHFMRPLVAAVWSCDPGNSLEYPARSLLTFLDHHGMLSVKGSPAWRTVTGGSRVYVNRVIAELDDVRLSTRVTHLERLPQAVAVTDHRGSREVFDAAVVATHPRQALEFLAAPTPLERETLSALEYSVNPAQLHTDQRLLPSNTRARASWNYRMPTGAAGDRAGVLVTYDLTRLMRLPSPGGQRLLVTLNGSDFVDKSQVIAEMTYEHPLFTMSALRAQQQLANLATPNLAFAGAYHGWGFHEDGALSGRRAAEAIGGVW